MDRSAVCFAFLWFWSSISLVQGRCDSGDSSNLALGVTTRCSDDIDVWAAKQAQLQQRVLDTVRSVLNYTTIVEMEALIGVLPANATFDVMYDALEEGGLDSSALDVVVDALQDLQDSLKEAMEELGGDVVVNQEESEVSEPQVVN